MRNENMISCDLIPTLALGPDHLPDPACLTVPVNVGGVRTGGVEVVPAVHGVLEVNDQTCRAGYRELTAVLARHGIVTDSWNTSTTVLP